MQGSATRLHMMDSNDNLLLKVVYYPYLSIEKDASSYILTRKYYERINEIVRQ